MANKTELAAQYVAKFPSISKSSIAAKLFNDFPTIYKDQEDARTFIRNATGSLSSSRDGKKYSYTNKITHTPDLPPSLSKQRVFVDLPVSSNNILWMSDIHLPNHDIDAINLATKFGIDKKINCIVLGGDILDNTPFTSHDSPPPSADDVRDWFEYAEILFSHLRTWKAHVWRNINESSFTDENGEYFKAAPDAAYSYPMIEMCGDKHYEFIPEILLVYNEENPHNEHKEKASAGQFEQARVSQIVRNLPKYQKL
jgi:hypothetical protein